MMQYISLLRGINVSGQKRIPMKDLQELYEKLSLAEVQTYIQSGNVLFKSEEKDADKLAAKIESAIKKHFGFEVIVIIRTKEELERVLKKNPFASKDEGRLYVVFLSQKPAKVDSDELDKYKSKSEEFVIVEREIYLSFPEGYGKTKLSNNLFERKLEVNATTRNWNTVKKLISLTK